MSQMFLFSGHKSHTNIDFRNNSPELYKGYFYCSLLSFQNIGKLGRKGEESAVLFIIQTQCVLLWMFYTFAFELKTESVDLSMVLTVFLNIV